MESDTFWDISFYFTYFWVFIIKNKFPQLYYLFNLYLAIILEVYLHVFSKALLIRINNSTPLSSYPTNILVLFDLEKIGNYSFNILSDHNILAYLSYADVEEEICAIARI